MFVKFVDNAGLPALLETSSIVAISTLRGATQITLRTGAMFAVKETLEQAYALATCEENRGIAFSNGFNKPYDATMLNPAWTSTLKQHLERKASGATT